MIMVSRRVFGASCKSFAAYPVPIIYGAIIFRDGVVYIHISKLL